MENKDTAAIVFLPGEGDGPALMLEDILFDPAALWLCESLKRAGVTRFLAVCRDTELGAASACFPEDTQFVTTSATDAPERLRGFLEQCGGNVVVVTRPVLLGDDAAAQLVHERAGAGALGKTDTGVYRLEAKTLLSALEAGEELEEALKGHGEPMGGTSVWFQSVHILKGGWEGRMESELTARKYAATRLMMGGVRILDPNSVYVGPQVTVGEGTRLLPGTILRGRTQVGPNCEVGPNTQLQDVTVGECTSLNTAQCFQCTIGSHTTVGPFAYIRPNTHVSDHVKVGDFVELKNSEIGKGTKISHLTYVGDSDVGEHINFGCGTVTVNYDGAKKFRTKIGDHAFIGCNTNLVAPVEVGEGAYIAAGSTITRDVPADSLAIARSEQTVKNQWAKKRRAKQGK